VSLPTDAAARKLLPIFRGCVMYFPDVWAAVAEVSRKGNDQHNPGQPLHWSREKSSDHMDTLMRHAIDHGAGNLYDIDGSLHIAKVVWRSAAECQLTIEAEKRAADERAKIIAGAHRRYSRK